MIVARGAFQHLPKLDHILQAVDHPGGGRIAVPAGPPGFLVVSFQTFGQIHMGHKPHVGLVDTHAESNGSHHNDPIFPQKPLLVLRAHLRRQASVIGQRGVTFTA